MIDGFRGGVFKVIDRFREDASRVIDRFRGDVSRVIDRFRGGVSRVIDRFRGGVSRVLDRLLRLLQSSWSPVQIQLPSLFPDLRFLFPVQHAPLISIQEMNLTKRK